MLFSSKFLVHINSTLHLLHLFNYVVYVVVFPDPLVGLHFFVVVVINSSAHSWISQSAHGREPSGFDCCATPWEIYHNLHIEMISFLLWDIKYRSIFTWGLLVCKQILFPCLATNDFLNRWLCGSSFAFHVNFCRCLRFSLFLVWLLVLLLVHV